MKNRHKQYKTKETAVNGTRDLVIANRVSGKVHGGLSRIRLSLTFRIALHYCVQLFRSFIPVALILTVMMCLFVSYPVSRELRQMIEDEGLIDIFYERAFERLIPQGHTFRIVDTTRFFSIELDTPEDFENAQRLIPAELY